MLWYCTCRIEKQKEMKRGYHFRAIGMIRTARNEEKCHLVILGHPFPHTVRGIDANYRVVCSRYCIPNRVSLVFSGRGF